MAITSYFSDTDVRRKYKGMVVAVGGPPHSGKSVFLANLYWQIVAKRPSGVFLQRACPDGEGMWSAQSDPAIVKEIRRKGTFSPEFIMFVKNSIPNLGTFFPIVFLDLGGRRTAENAEILRGATHLIILSSNQAENEPWSQFAAAEGCQTLCVLASRLVKTADGGLDQEVRSSVDLSAEPVRGEFLNLDREAGTSPYADAISQLADWLITKSERQ